MRRCSLFALIASLFLALSAGHAIANDLPDPKTGGKDGGPVDILLLRGHAEMNFGNQPPLDETYQQHLADRGYRITIGNSWQPLTTDYLNQFNTVIYLNPEPYMGGGYFDAPFWRSGGHLLTVRKNIDVLEEWVRSGGGLMFVPALEEIGMRTVESLRHLFGRFGMDTHGGAVRDYEHGFEAAKVIGRVPIIYSYTEQIAKDHPATQGVKRIFYPAYCTRWDDNYTTIPLLPKDDEWDVLVRGEDSSNVMYLRGTIYDPGAPWIAADGLSAPGIIASRQLGKGRLAISGIGPFHLFYLTYSETGKFAEANFVRVDGIAMERGDGERTSDLKTLLDNLYRYLAEPSLAAGMGGYDAANAVELSPPNAVFDKVTIADAWSNDDPMVTGKVRPMKFLVGARSAISSGAGTPADWAAAAKAAGVDVVCFTETLEDVDHAKWAAYAQACRDASDEHVTLMPGYDAGTDLGNRFLLVGHYQGLRKHILSKDGRQLTWTGHMLIGEGDLLPIAARPAQMDTVRDTGKLPPDLYSHCPGVALATYKDGKQVDDGLFAYKRLLFNGTVPIPVAVHEVADPANLSTAASTGMHSYVNSDTPAHAAHYFRQGHAAFGGNPARFYVSGGPTVDRYRIDNWQSPHWSINLSIKGDQPITEVRVDDQRKTYRRFTPGTTKADVSWSGDLAAQHWFFVEVTDAQGNKAYLSPLRTLPVRHVVRCMDRQNWFAVGLPIGDVVYTGRRMKGPSVGVPGIEHAAALCPKLWFPYLGEGYIVHDFVIDSTLVPGGRDTGADNSPIFNELPIPEYASRVRHVSYMKPGQGRGYTGKEYRFMFEAKRDLGKNGEPWPVIGKIKASGDLAASFIDEQGAAQMVAIKPGEHRDVPAGTLVGDIVAVTPLRIAGDGRIGFADSDAITKGTHFEGAYIPLKPNQIEQLSAEFGITQDPPFSFDLTQGKLLSRAGWLKFAAKDHGVAGTIKGGESVFLQGWYPADAQGLSPNWPIGVWTPEYVLPYSVLDGRVMARINVTQDTAFYFGNLLTASNESLCLAFVDDWTADATTIEVHNPTDKPITATVSSPAAITNHVRVNESVTVPAGASATVKVGG